jgi:RNA polymerase sigma factor (sigma-70 family)
MPLPENREALVVKHIWLVEHIANIVCKPFKSYDQSYELVKDLKKDLKQEGIIGLIKAVDAYDSKKGAQLSTYAYRRIRGAMLDYLATNTKQGIRISKLLRDRARKVSLVHDELMRKLVRKPTLEELVQAAGMTIEEVKSGLDLMAMSLVKISDITGDSGMPLAHSDSSRSPETAVIFKSQIEAVISALQYLSPDRREALKRRYCEGLSNSEVAVIMGKNEGAVKVLVHRGVEDLRRIFRINHTSKPSPRKAVQNFNHGGGCNV